MTDEQLFDTTPYDDGTSRRRGPRARAKEQELVPRPPGYHAVTNRSGPKGFHRTKVPEAAMARHGSVVTLCGILGRRLDAYPGKIPLCEECERMFHAE